MSMTPPPFISIINWTQTIFLVHRLAARSYAWELAMGDESQRPPPSGAQSWLRGGKLCVHHEPQDRRA